MQVSVNFKLFYFTAECFRSITFGLKFDQSYAYQEEIGLYRITTKQKK